MQLNLLMAGLAAMAATGGALAQPTPQPPNAAASTVATGAYRSAFEGYRRHADQPVMSWRDANDTVGRVGGWQAYAREAAGTLAPSSSAPVPAGPAKTGGSAPKAADGSAGHGAHGAAGSGVGK